MGHLPALQGHQHPAGDRGVAGRAGRVAPAAALRVLGIDDEREAPLGRVFQGRIVRHAVGLAQGDGRQGLAVHAAVAQVGAVGEHDVVPQQVIQAVLHHVLVLARLVRVAGAEERQQGQGRGRRGAGFGAGVAAVVHAGLADVIEVPASIVALMGH